MDNSLSSDRTASGKALLRQEGRGKYSPDRLGILRVPVYPITLSETLVKCERKQLREIVENLLGDPVFQEALYIAAPGLHEKSAKWLAGDASLDDIDLAIARYALRMSHRPIPFGTFSSVSALTVEPGATQLRAVDPHNIKKLASIDYGVLAELCSKVVSSDVGNVVRYALNDTLTIHSDYISYIKVHRNASMNAQHVAELERSEVLDFVLEAAHDHEGMTITELVAVISKKFSTSHTEEEIAQFVNALRAEDVLVADSLLDPTSNDQLSTLIGRLAVVPPELETMRAVAALLRRVAVSPLGGSLKELRSISELISTAGPKSAKRSHVVAYAPVTSGSLSETCMHAVEGALTALAEYTPKNNRLKIFKERFAERFGDAFVPLSSLVPLLDSMGYPDAIRPSAALADQFPAQKKSKNRVQASPLNGPESYAVSVIAASGSSEFVDISNYRAPHGSVSSKTLPSCIVAWLALWDGGESEVKIELKSVGSQEPGRLMGRFSGVLPELLTYLKEVETPPPGKIFAQIVAVPVERAGSVISRPATESPEIRLRAGGRDTDIKLSDLDVFVSNSRVSLWSRSRQAEIVPRMNSAHAYDRCKGASVYVFLNNVANQDDFCRMPSLRAKLRDAPYLPGITYNDLIIERPTWHVSSEALGLSKCSDDQAIERIRNWAQDSNFPEMAEEHGASAPLLFSLSSDWMARDFLKQLKKAGALTLTCAFPMQMRPALRCSSGPHTHEIQIAMRSQQIARRFSAVRHTFDSANAQCWVYVCVYCKTANQNSVVDSLFRAVRSAIGDRVEFFFVRYRDKDGDQVRLRFKAFSRDDRSTIIRTIEDACIKLEAAGFIYEFVFKNYAQEIGRYQGLNLMSLAERVFSLDSRSIMRTFGKIPMGLHDYWRSAGAGADAFLRALGLESLHARLVFATRAAENFQREFKFDSTRRRMIGVVFKNSDSILLDTGECDPTIPCFAALTDVSEMRSLINASHEFSALGEADAYSFGWSLIHMRFNRIFPREARLQEAICWELLKRSYLRCMKKMGMSDV
ncbi:thiopeptide-type bacteriocin biosynthesis protein [Xanthomonas arboricola]|uniref:lantibiotic dehydratase n=1 Tax=Xanthomonas campestris TaxID=339 RepID=UPI0023EA064E|nr:thiopeptide-type bacteriocin biosynthesis protein [Xanthomonas campestris]